MSKHSAHEIQEGLGQTGRFGEVFVGLAVLIALAGVILWVLANNGAFADSPVGAGAARGDAFILGFLLVVEGIGFAVFGVMAMLAGWARHHADFEF